MKSKELERPVWEGWPFSTRWPSLTDRWMTPFKTLNEDWDWNPHTEIKETDDAYVLTIELPGVKPEEVKLTVQSDVIMLSGEKHEEKVENEQHTHIRERTYGSFHRTFTLPMALDADHVEAEMKDGVLIVKVQKSKEGQPRSIAVHSV